MRAVQHTTVYNYSLLKSLLCQALLSQSNVQRQAAPVATGLNTPGSGQGAVFQAGLMSLNLAPFNFLFGFVRIRHIQRKENSGSKETSQGSSPICSLGWQRLAETGLCESSISPWWKCEDSGLGSFLQLPFTELQKSLSVFPGTSLSASWDTRLPGASLFDLYWCTGGALWTLISCLWAYSRRRFPNTGSP